MDLKALRYFLACVEQRSFHGAARAVRISQPSLSRAVHNLEQELGVTLLDRNPRGVTPTPYGAILARYARMLESDVRRARAEIESLRGGRGEQVRVGAGPVLAEAVLAPAMTRLAVVEFGGKRHLLAVSRGRVDKIAESDIPNFTLPEA